MRASATSPSSESSCRASPCASCSLERCARLTSRVCAVRSNLLSYDVLDTSSTAQNVRFSNIPTINVRGGFQYVIGELAAVLGFNASALRSRCCFCHLPAWNACALAAACC